jgi:glycosyltransferase involved in cell wall biosynthesis
LAVHKLHFGGNERDLAKLARHLNPDRWQVHVAAFWPEGDRHAELEAAGIPILDLAVRSFRNGTCIRGARLLHSYIRRYRIQLIQAFDPPTSTFLVPLGQLFGVPAVISTHSFFRTLIPPSGAYPLRMVDFLADRIAVNADAVKQHLVADYGISARKIFVSYNGVETDVFFPKSEARPQFLSNASIVIGSLCVMREEKRIDLLLEAFATVLASHPEAKLLIVGEGDMLEAWQRRRNELALGDSCRFEPTSGNVPYWLRCMDIFVLPSRSEGFPNTLLEAMACGCCVIASKIGGVPEMVDHERTGLLFQPGNANALGSTLLRIVGDPSLRKSLAEAAAIEARERFSMEAAAARMDAFYTSVLDAA